jgi:hypothetical protein
MRAGCLLMLFALVAAGCGGSATAPSAAVVRLD